MKHKVFITGGTGYMGSRLIPLLVNRGHEVKALVRLGSERKLLPGAACVPGDPLQMDTYAAQVSGCDAFVHLIGVPHPSPSKAAQFRAVDAVSIRVAARAAQAAGIRHFIYLSVAHPAPMMEAYIAVRSEGEDLIRSLNMPATFARPWYVLGPGHRWPYVLIPFYWLCERLPNTREGARRLGLVTIAQMTRALLWAVEHPSPDVRILDVPGIREVGRASPESPKPVQSAGIAGG
jgi:nucleoside-diphosphate-sugar epimerase